MSLNSAKKITRRSWDTIPIPDTVIARVNELSWNEPDRFIFIDRRDRPIGDINTIREDRDSVDNNGNNSLQDPTHKFQATEKAEEEPIIPDPNIDLEINHKTNTEQLQAPKESPEDPITVTVQLSTTTEEGNRPNHPSTGVRRSSRVKMQTNSYNPSITGNHYSCSAAKMV